MARPCAGCPALINGKAPLCADCRKRKRQASRRRNPRTDAHYGDAGWRRTSRRFLAANPRCMDCGAPATDVDHAPPRRILEALGIFVPDAPPYLSPRCHSCHSRVTRLIDQPLLARLEEGDDPQVLAELSLELRRQHSHALRGRRGTPIE